MNPSSPLDSQSSPRSFSLVMDFTSSAVQSSPLDSFSVNSMGGPEIGSESVDESAGEYVYRISTRTEWEELQNTGSVYGGPLDKSSGFIHLSNLNQVKSTLQNFFLDSKEDLYLLQIDAKKLGDGLVYEAVDPCNSFPHFFGPSRGFSPLLLNVVTKADKLSLSDGQFTAFSGLI